MVPLRLEFSESSKEHVSHRLRGTLSVKKCADLYFLQKKIFFFSHCLHDRLLLEGWKIQPVTHLYETGIHIVYLIPRALLRNRTGDCNHSSAIERTRYSF